MSYLIGDNMFLILLLKGFLIGIAFIIPGLSGGTLAVYLGVYEKMLHAIGNIFKEFKKSVTYLLPIFIGIGVSVVSLAWLFSILLNWNSFIVLFFFIGLMLGGIKHIYNTASKDKLDLSKILAFVIAFLLVILLVLFEKTGNNVSSSTIDITLWNLIVVFLVGMAASMTMIVPGISGSALLLVLGFYTPIVSNVIGRLLDFSNIGYNLTILLPFGIGVAVGIVLFSKVIDYFLKNHKSATYYAILGFIIASCIAVFFEIKDHNTAQLIDDQIPIYKDILGFIGNNIISVLGGLLTISLGFIAAKLLTKMELNRIQ